MIKRWKFIREGFKSENGNVKWKVGEWQEPIKDLEMCNKGYHCSKKIYQAFSYVQGEVLAQVECKGKHQSTDDKEVWENQRVVKAYKWTKKDSVALSIYVAELCLENFEKVYPSDKRPREAIEAAKKWLKNPTAKNQSAAESAAWSARSAAESAAWSAESASWSAESAAWSAESAESARSAAWSASWSAESAALSAESARSAAESAESARSAAESASWSAESAAWSALVKKIFKWMDKRLLVLKEIK